MKVFDNNRENIIHEMSQNNDPIGTVKPDEQFIIKTASPGIPDETFEKDYSDKDYPKRVLSITGPVFIEGAQPGDTLKIDISKIELFNHGKMWMGQWMGLLMDEMDHNYMKNVEVNKDKVKFDENIDLPLRKMIGTIGVAPLDTIECLYPGDHGGNLDLPSITEGSSVYLPVYTEGALLAIGDVHAAMGNGEIYGTGVEIGSEVTLSVSIIKDTEINSPIVETENSIRVVSSKKDLLEACKEVTRKAIQFVEGNNEYSFDESYALVGQACNIEIAQLVNPLLTVSMQIPKSILLTKEIKLMV